MQKLLLMLLCSGLFCGQSFTEEQMLTQKEDQPDYAEQIPPEKLKADLDLLFKTIEEVHPNMYAYTSRKEFEPIRKELCDKATVSLTSREFYKEAAKAITYLKFGHCLVAPPELRGKFIESKILPLKLSWEGEDVVVIQDFSKSDIEGSKLLEIDGCKTEDLVEEYKMYLPDEGNVGNPNHATRLIGYFLWLKHGEKDSYKVVIQKKKGQKFKYQVKSVLQKTIAGNKSAQEYDNLKGTFTYQHIENSDVSIITIKSFTAKLRPGFDKFLKSAFQDIKEQNVANIIIDIRKNGGGASFLGDDLLEYLTDKPYRQFESYKCKISKQLLDPSNNALNRVEGENPDELKVGNFVGHDVPFTKPGNNSLRHDGDIYVLIGNGVFSSSQSFAAAIKCFKIGIMVGQETGSTTIEYGDMISFIMPNSGVKFWVPCKYFVLAGGKHDGRGVIPDYEVKQKPEDTAKDVDTVLQFTLDLIKKKNSEKFIKN